MQRGFVAILTVGILALSALSASSEHVALHELDAPKVIYVDDDAPGGNDGSNWTNAFNNLQDALVAARAGDEIRVGQGIYRPAGINGDPAATFALISGVVIKGGFAGVGTKQPDGRDVMAFKSILSGDLNGDDGLDMENVEDNSRHVLTGSGTGPTTVLDGFVITAGTGSYNGGYGGGLYNITGSPTVNNCIFTKIRGTRGYAGNAIYNYDGSSPFISNCIFEGNYHFGGLHSGLRSVPTVVNCVFLDNYWAAIEQYGGDMVIANCIFEDCYWAMFLDYCDADVRNCLFYDNDLVVMPDGGAQPVFTNCIENTDPLFVDRYGGDYHLQSDSPCIDSGDNSVVQPSAGDLDGNERIINGIVDMGVFEMAAAVQANLRIVPQVISRNNRRARVLARIRLPEEISIDQIDTEQVLMLYPGEIEAERQYFFSARRTGQKVVHGFAFFDKDKLMQAVPDNGDVELTVTGRLNDGSVYSGTDTVTITGESNSLDAMGE